MSPSREATTSVDQFLAKSMLATQNSTIDFDSILKANRDAELPAIDVSPLQGKLLQLLVQMMGARRVLEIGTLGGYSTAWMASGLPNDGEVVTIEINALHAGVAVSNLKLAELSDRVTLRLGSAQKILGELIRDEVEPFDFVFIDADKPSGVEYFEAALKLTRPGSMILLDNVVRGGAVINDDSDDPDVIGTQKLIQCISVETRVSATAIQTVGQKGHDGFALLRVLGDS